MRTIAVIRIASQYNNEGDCLPRTVARCFPSDAPLSEIWEWVNSVSGGPEQRLLLSGPELSQQKDEPVGRISTGSAEKPLVSSLPEDDCPF